MDHYIVNSARELIKDLKLEQLIYWVEGIEVEDAERIHAENCKTVLDFVLNLISDSAMDSNITSAAYNLCSSRSGVSTDPLHGRLYNNALLRVCDEDYQQG